MNTRTTISLIVSLLPLLFPAKEAVAQDIKDIAIYKAENVSLLSANSAWLGDMNDPGISVARLFMEKGNGGFVNYNESDNSITGGIESESFRRLSKTVCIYGAISYEYFQGQNMAGSSLFDPYSSPFNIVDSDNNPGRKQKELYSLSGGISSKISRRLSLGARFDYQSGNYAKFKDLRHINSLLDLSASAGLAYKISPSFALGLNYIHRRRVESVNFLQSGISSVSYSSLIDLGSFYGFNSTFGDGSVNSSSSQPMRDAYNGAGLQLKADLGKNLSLFSEAQYLLRSGYYGVKSSKTVVFFESGGGRLDFNTGLKLKSQKATHIWGLNAWLDMIDNFRNSYEKKTDAATGNTVVKYFGSNKVNNKNLLSSGLTYKSLIDESDGVPKWEVDASLAFDWHASTTTIYPFYREQMKYLGSLALGAARNIRSGNNIFKTALSAGCSYGAGNKAEDGLFVATDAAKPASNNHFLDAEFDYFTSPRMMLGGSFGYTRVLKDKLALYSNLAYRFTHATGAISIPANRHLAELSLGILFQ